MEQKQAEQIEPGTGVPVTHVFFHRNGSPIRDFRKAWRNACDRAGLAKLIPHDVRRCAARNLLRARVSQPVAKRLLGRETQEIFRRYSIVDAGDAPRGGGNRQSKIEP